MLLVTFIRVGDFVAGSDHIRPVHVLAVEAYDVGQADRRFKRWAGEGTIRVLRIERVA